MYVTETIRIAPDDLTLVMHVWSAPAPRAIIFYIHGLQSHGGWLFDTGPALSSMGCSVYALDRRGSGRSEGARGDVRHHGVWCDDYLGAMRTVRDRHPGIPLLLVGQSFGGTVAAGVASDPRACHDALLVCAPALRPKDVAGLWDGIPDDEPVPLPLRDDWYTSDPNYLGFIEQDELMVRAITPRFAAARHALAAHYFSLNAPLAARPSAMVLPRHDRIIDLAQAREAYDELTGHTGIAIELPTRDHYLEFSSCRRDLWCIEAAFATTLGFSRTSPGW